jgi:hypothetical protein
MVYVEGSNYFARDSRGNIICKNSNCIQEAINYVSNLGGGKVYLKKGTYRTNEYIFIRSDNIELYGDGMGLTIIENHARYGPAIYIGKDSETSIVARNIYIHDLTIDAKYQYDSSDPVGNGNSTLWAYYVSDLILERIEHRNAYWRTSITLGWSGCDGKCIQENIIIRNNVFRGVALTLGGIQNLIFEDNIFYGTATSPDYNTILDFSYGEIQDSYIYNAVVKNNIFYKVYRHPNDRVGWASVVAGFQRAVGVIWENNIFVDPDICAISIKTATELGTQLDTRGIEFIGNTIIGLGRTNYGIIVRNGRVSIKNNYIENMMSLPIAVSDAEAVIESNYIVSAQEGGIWVSNGRATIIDNMLKECAQSRFDCIIADGSSSYVVIMGNRMYRSVETHLPSAVNTSTSQGYNIVMGNIAEGQWTTPKYRSHPNDIETNNI